MLFAIFFAFWRFMEIVTLVRHFPSHFPLPHRNSKPN